MIDPLLVLGQVEIRDRSGPPSCEQANELFCPGWAFDNFDRYVDPAAQHLVLVVASVLAGFAIAFAMALLAHRFRWLAAPLLGVTGVLYTVPSIAFFFLLLPITGLGRTTAIIALTAFSLQILYRNIMTGLRNVPAEVRDAGRGMGLTDRQLLWRAELPLALPEIFAGLRIATVSTVALATLAVFANGGGLGVPIYEQIDFKTNIIVAGGLCMLIAVVFDLLLLAAQRALTPWRRIAE
jgi:osmoprotectant transport system permease protein